VLVFLSQHSVAKRGYVQREFKLALNALEEIPEGVIHTIPLRLDDSEVPEQFNELQWCNLFEEDGFERLVQAIRKGVFQRQQPESVARITNSIGMEFVLIAAGTFLMGSHDGNTGEQPVHQAT
jgi:formylglycine-generating enzyme required for sulfatase activity